MQTLHSSSHRSKEGESVLEQPLPERISFIHGFLKSKTLNWCWGK